MITIIVGSYLIPPSWGLLQLPQTLCHVSVSSVRCNFGGASWIDLYILHQFCWAQGLTEFLIFKGVLSLLSPHGCHGSFRVALWHLDTPSSHSFEAHLSVGLLPSMPSIGVPLLFLCDSGHLGLQVPQGDPKLVEVSPRQR